MPRHARLSAILQAGSNGRLCSAEANQLYHLYWKKIHPLSERLVSFGIMEAQLKAPLKPFNTIDTAVMVRWVQENHKLNPMMPRNASPSDSYTRDRRCFSSLLDCRLRVAGLLN